MRQWIVTFGGAGKSPIAPGTTGSLAAIVVIIAFHFLLPGVSLKWFLLAGILIASALSVALGPWAIAHYGRSDPGAFVLDEVAGICLTMIFLPVLPGGRELWVALVAFVSFRLFDVWKPPPCGRLEKLPAGWGILTDDLMAAVYANLLCQVVVRGLLHF